MLLAYVDDSGNTGAVNRGGATPYYALGCVILNADDWPTNFDHMVGLRRSLKANFGVPVRAELKANYLIRGSGPLRGLGLAPSQRHLIYRYHLHAVAAMRGRAFAVVVDKAASGTSGSATFDLAWTTLLQRLERTTHFDGQQLMLIHDEGEDDRVRKQYRKARRYLPAGSFFQPGQHIQLAAPRFVEDPVSRSSQQSYFIQLADLVAYAGWRTLHAPSPNIGQVVPQMMWNRLGSAIHTPVNRLRRVGTPGVVIRP